MLFVCISLGRAVHMAPIAAALRFGAIVSVCQDPGSEHNRGANRGAGGGAGGTRRRRGPAEASSRGVGRGSGSQRNRGYDGEADGI